MKIFIRPGHGGSDPGAAANGLIEKDINLVVALKAKECFLVQGFEVLLAREDDTFVSLEEGVNMANAWEADIFISIHHNAGGGDGAEVYHTIYGGKGKVIGQYIMDQFRKLGQNVRYLGARESLVNTGHDYYYEIRWTDMPALITEFAFLDTADSEAIDELPEQHAEGETIVKGICAYLGQEYKGETPSAPEGYTPPYVVDLIPQGLQMQMFDDHLEVRRKLGNEYGPWKVIKFD